MPIILDDIPATRSLVAESKVAQDRLDSIDNSTLTQQSHAWGHQFGKNNLINTAMEKMGEKTFEPDEDYVGVHPDVLQSIMTKNKVSPEYLSDFVGIKSQNEFDDKMFTAVEKTQDDRFINETIGRYGKSSASVAGALLNVDFVAGVGIGSMFKLKKISDVLKVTGSVETATAVAKSQIDDDYKLEEAAVDIALGVIIDTGVVRFLNGSDVAKAADEQKMSDNVRQV